MEFTPSALSVNVGAAEPSLGKDTATTGIRKRPVTEPVAVRAPGPKRTGLHSGIVGDHIGDTHHHGGDDQAVYAYAAEDYAWWSARLGRDLPPGIFGENLTTSGLDLVGAVIGERWEFGSGLALQVTFGRIPCVTFQNRMGEPRWVKRFAQANRTGAYLRVLVPGQLVPGDTITVTDRPGHGLTVAEGFDIYLHDVSRLPRLLEAPELPPSMLAEIRERLG
ncbi:MOSC domain-containing protein [Actinoplanes teichomyceticus]|nr:MOSC domain-containing protein [Actinoplanes teichomyceticus]